MESRKLGKSQLEIAPLVLGGNVFGWTIDEATSFKVLDAFVGGGFNCIDTADIYSVWVKGHTGGESERVIGNWLKQRGGRDKVVIATKVGMEMAPGKKGLRKDYILKSVDESLQRLQTDYIDLYQAHEDDPNTPLEETMAAFADLVKAGKVRVVGASNYKGERLAQALEVSAALKLPRYESLQPNYNLYVREEYEQTLEPVCREHRLGVITYFSLAAGFLTGKYRSEADFEKSARGPGMKKYLNERGLKILAALDSVAAHYSTTQTAVALAWLLARPSVTAPIASATSLQQLETLFAGARLKLSSDAVDELDRASAW